MLGHHSQLIRQMMGFDPFADMMNDGFFRDPFMQQQQHYRQQQQQYLQQQQQQQQQHNSSRSNRRGGSDGGPIIEEPDDEPVDDFDNHSHFSSRQQQGSMMQSFGFPGLEVMFSGPASGGANFSFSSTSIRSSGSGQPQVVYSQTSKMTVGPGGVVERQEQVHDGRSGLERITLERRLGDRARRVVKERDRTGREDTRDHLENMSREEAQRFEQEWRQAAAHSSLAGGSMPRIMHPHAGPTATRPVIEDVTHQMSSSRQRQQQQPQMSQPQIQYSRYPTHASNRSFM